MERFDILKKYNFWGGAMPHLGYIRTEYTDKIYSYAKSNRLIKVLVGQRRVGKSYILRQLAAKLIDDGVPNENIVFINCELAEFRFLRGYQDLSDLITLYRREIQPQGRVYLFLDEVQNIDQWELIVNSYSQDYVDEYELFISGSNSKMLASELATLLSGRYISFEIYPFSFEEWAGVVHCELSRGNYEQYMFSGGLPELFALPNEETKRNYISSIKDTVLLRDIIQRYNIKNAKLLEDIFVYIINNASNLLSVRNVANYFNSSGRKSSYETVSAYLGYIEDTHLIHRVERYNIRGKETISGTCKYYANDLSFNNYLYQGFGYGAGYLLENLIYLDLARKGYAIYVGTIRNKEVDFVAIKGDRKIYIQVAYQLTERATIDREYSALEGIDDNYEKIVVSADSIQLPLKDGIRHVRAWEFFAVL
ncbi:MAG: ATP-binding protein [Rikenellaceae bacterium]